jgi:hypothetical protein
MKTPIIIALSIVSVLGTAGAAMAVNAGTLASFNRTSIGNAPTVLDPTLAPTSTATPTPEADDSSTAAPEPSETAEPTTSTPTAPKSSDHAAEPTEEPKYTPSPTPTRTYSGGDHGDDNHTGSGSDD